MPQLDKLSFMPQLVYFFSIYFGVYLVLSKGVLPSLSRTLKIRKAMLESKERAMCGLSSEGLTRLYKIAVVNYVEEEETLLSKAKEAKKQIGEQLEVSYIFGKVNAEVREELIDELLAKEYKRVVYRK